MSHELRFGTPTPPKLQDFFVRSPSEHKGCADKSQETWLHRVRDLPLCSLCPTRVVTNMNQQFLYDLWTWWLPSPGCLYFPLCWLALEFHWFEFQHYMIDDHYKVLSTMEYDSHMIYRLWYVSEKILIYHPRSFLKPHRCCRRARRDPRQGPVPNLPGEVWSLPNLGPKKAGSMQDL